MTLEQALSTLPTRALSAIAHGVGGYGLVALLEHYGVSQTDIRVEAERVLIRRALKRARKESRS